MLHKYRPCKALVGCLILIMAAAAARAEDWPTYQHDNRRSCRTAERIDAASLAEEWSFRCPQFPQYAWHGPSRFDYYHNTGPFTSMREYDPVYYPVVVGKSLFFATTGDDSIYCLDTAAGKVKWTFTADAPIRIAPGCYDDRLYFGSDDGFAYCIDARDGRLIWEYSPVLGRRRMFNNGKLISPYPIRSGVAVAGGTAYFMAGMLPWGTSYFCAVDAKTGEARYVREYTRRTPEGAIAAYEGQVMLPNGRFGGMRFGRADGKEIGGTGGSGAFMLITEDGHLFQGPGKVRGSVTDAALKKGVATAGIGAAYRLVAGGDFIAYVHDRHMICIDRQMTEQQHRGKKRLVRSARWRIDSFTPYGLVLAGETIFAGGRNKVIAVNSADGKVVWEGRVRGKAYGLAVANGRLFVSTHEGFVYSFKPGATRAAAQRTAGGLKEDAEKKADEKEKPKPLPLAMHPYLQYLDADSAVVRWETAVPMPTVFVYGFGGESRRIEDKTPRTEHEVVLKDLQRDAEYTYVIHGEIDGRPCRSAAYKFDTFFNYNMPNLTRRRSPYPKDELSDDYAAAAEHILKNAGIDRGVCLVLGGGRGRLAYELATRSRLRVICVDTDASAVDAARKALLAAGVYGRVTAHHVESLKRLPFVGDFANLVVSDRLLSEGRLPGAAPEMVRVLRPDGGLVLLRRPNGVPKAVTKDVLAEYFKAASVEAAITEDAAGIWAAYRRPPLPGTGVWGHQYATAANTAYGGEELRGATRCEQLSAQWVGRPGPRLQVDRYQRKPAPLSAGGRLFVQGLNRIVCLDAYNGVALWSLDLPAFLRFNVPRDCSNWCTDGEHVFLAVDNRCFQISAADGAVERFHYVAAPSVEDARKDWPWVWGYVGREADMIVGSAVKAGTNYKYYAGPGAWYDARGLPQVCSDGLFAIEKATGRLAWTYAPGLIMNSTITLAGGRVYLTESRTPGLIPLQNRRLGVGLWHNWFLVALDLKTGRKLWETKLPLVNAVDSTYLAFADGKLVLATSAAKVYHVRCFGAAGGQEIWHESFSARGNHGAHIKRPAVVNGRIFMRSRMMNLETGKLIQMTPGEGCGTISASRHAIVGRRRGMVSLWGIGDDPNDYAGWHKLRPSCWLSTFPAAGMLLSPEGGAGCRCGWYEISVAFKPRVDQTAFRTPGGGFFDTVYVKLTRPLGGGDVYYTLDGGPPTLTSARYDGPIRLRKSAAIRACGATPGPNPTLGEEVSRRFTRVEVALPASAKINFQPHGASAAEGFLPEVGRFVQKRDNDYAFGWNANMWKAAGGNRKAAEPEATFVNLRGGVKWECCVANGRYNVTLAVSGSLPSLKVEDVVFCKDAKPKGSQPQIITRTVTVSDHKLTVCSDVTDPGAQLGRIHYLTFEKR